MNKTAEELSRPSDVGDADRATAAASPTISSLTETYGDLRGRSQLLTADIEDGHRSVRRWDLDERTSLTARRSPASLLEGLAVDRGMSWASIAKLVGVSVSAVRKWRAGEPVSPENRYGLAQLTAFMGLVEEMPVEEPSSWLGMSLVTGYTTTGADVYRAGLVDDLLDYAAGHIGPRELLVRHDPDWQRNAAQEWEIAETTDGERLIRRRG